MNDFGRFRLACNMYFIRSVMLAVTFIYIIAGIIRSVVTNDNGADIWMLRVGIVVFILSLYAFSYTEMFKEYYEYWLALFVIVNSANLLCMGMIVEGAYVLMETPFSIVPYALIVLVVNYIFPIRYKIAICSGILVSAPYIIMALWKGSLSYTMTMLMLLIVLNVLLSFNSYSNEKMMKELWKCGEADNG